MFNVTIINAKGSIKKVFAVLVILIITFGITKIATKIKEQGIQILNISNELINCLNKEIPAISSICKEADTVLKEDREEVEEKNFAEKILKVELAKMRAIEDTSKENVIKNDETVSQEDNKLTNTNEEIEANIITEEVTQNPITETSNMEIEGVKIKNETSFEINNEIIESSLDINKENILIFHTHTCESYTPSEQYQYEQTGNFRTTDLNYSVSRVGDELTQYLEKFNFNVYHDKTYHDYPAYSGSYKRSLATVEELLNNNNSDIIIDLHRDAIGSKSNYDPSVKIGEDVSAKLMFVIGTNGGGLYHPNWKSNLEFAIKVQKKANEMYPGLFKPIIVRNSRYNQHLSKAACIIEVGATGNTMEQCLNSMKYLSKVFDEIRNE